MTCEDIRDRITAYCDGELSRSERQSVETHVETCDACRAELAREREVIRIASTWRRDALPERDLWPSIEAEIRSPRGRVVRGPWSRVSRAGLAAAAVLVAVLSLVVVRQANPPEASRAVERQAAEETTGRSPSVPVSGPTELALASERALVEGGLMHVREDLLRSIAERRDDLDPETRQMVDRNLEIIDRALGEIYRALEQDPGNHSLEQLLADTYQHEAEFLKRINTL